ncbi:ABC transporter ATP-binding protein [Dongia sedimenti]|uniref:ABC transporter ATP-binding protein n=1 Tax=Dongia sedimenti TaxID=3064282 RepID=A0ABU0YHM9_9PROT|nr:ABC transporter ATP-binding protein [Rhodospirillaceae bacterium R-7]
MDHDLPRGRDRSDGLWLQHAGGRARRETGSGRMTDPVLEVRALSVTTAGSVPPRTIVDGVSFDLGAAEILGLVGESGSGKSVTCRALMRLLPPDSLRISGGAVWIGGRDIVAASEAQLHAVRGGEIGMIFQNPSSHLNPLMRIGEQIGESLRFHRGIGRREARGESIELLRQVGIADPESRFSEFPHQFSGGMRQRAMIAMALACHPAILIADEPTTALDVTVQAQILRLLLELRDKRGLSIILVTHDLGIVAQTCDAIAIMYAGRIAERGPKREVLRRPLHSYTARLIDCQPSRPTSDIHLATIPGQPPSLDDMPGGCRFHPRCDDALPVCRIACPELIDFSDAAAGRHLAACHVATRRRAEVA